MKKCIYLTEGECEEKLIRALKERPSLVLPGKVKKFNVIQNELPVSLLMQFDPGSIVVLIFDTDKDETSHLRKNIALLKSLSFKVEILTILQVLNFEDEIARATDVSKAQDLTRSKTINDFKSAVNRMKAAEGIPIYFSGLNKSESEFIETSSCGLRLCSYLDFSTS